jgi:type IV pilus assembly protein PilN
MIKLNLAAVEKPSQKKSKVASAAPGAFQFYLLLILCIGGALGLSAFLWVNKSMRLSDLDREIKDKQKRQQELQAIKKQVDELEAKRKVYQMKVELIERLRREQSDPVHMLDEISKALPDFVWLKTVEQTGSSIKITGMSSGMIAVADFVSNLQKSGWFPQVDMGPIKESREGGGQAQDFAVTGTFKNPETAQREAAERAAAAAAATPTPAKSAGKGAGKGAKR